MGHHRLGSTRPSSPPPKEGTEPPSEPKHMAALYHWTSHAFKTMAIPEHPQPSKIIPWSAPRTMLNTTSGPSLQLLQDKKKKQCALPGPPQLDWHLQLLASLGSSICSGTGLLGSWFHSKSVIQSPSRSSTSSAGHFQTPTSGSVI